jgi:hypothetical protein
MDLKAPCRLLTSIKLTQTCCCIKSQVYKGSKGTYRWDQDASNCGHGSTGVHQLSLLVPPQSLRVLAQTKRVKTKVTGQPARNGWVLLAWSEEYRACAETVP